MIKDFFSYCKRLVLRLIKHRSLTLGKNAIIMESPEVGNDDEITAIRNIKERGEEGVPKKSICRLSTIRILNNGLRSQPNK